MKPVTTELGGGGGYILSRLLPALLVQDYVLRKTSIYMYIYHYEAVRRALCVFTVILWTVVAFPRVGHHIYFVFRVHYLILCHFTYETVAVKSRQSPLEQGTRSAPCLIIASGDSKEGGPWEARHQLHNKTHTNGLQK